MTVSKKGIALMLISLALYITYVIIHVVAVYEEEEAFPKGFIQLYETNQLEVIPTPGTFQIWGFLFIYQLIWQLYALTTVFRRGEETNILSSVVYVLFSMYSITSIVELFLWGEQNIFGMLVTRAVSLFFLCLVIGYQSSDLSDYLKTHTIVHANKLDVWCQRLLVQNGLMFNVSWVCVSFMIEVAIFLTQELGVPTLTGSFLTLAVLGLSIVLWFILENSLLADYMAYTFAHYVPVLVGIGGMLKNETNKVENPEHIRQLMLGILIITCFLFVLRLGLTLLRWLRTKEDSSETLQLPLATKRYQGTTV